MTVLDAVNVMLQAVGQAKVMSLTNADMSEEATQALTILGNTNRDIQMRGWHCNTEEDFPLEPEAGTGNVYLPINLAAFTPSYKSYDMDLTQRGNLLYDLRGHTFSIGKTVYVNVILYLDFDALPEPLRWYVITRAARMFGVGKDPSSGTFKFTNEVENDAMGRAESFDCEARDETLPEVNMHFWNMRRR